MSTKIQRLMDKVAEAHCAVNAELLRLYPKDSCVRFLCKHGQRIASTGRVHSIGCRPGYLRVEHHQAKPYSRYAYRDVHYTQILGTQPAALAAKQESKHD
jgi:hypothetical protein